MASDTFICGTCQSIFHDIHLFVQHKSEGTCVVGMSSVTTEQSQPVTSLLRLTTDDMNCANPTYFIIQDGAILDDTAILLQSQSGGFGSAAVQTAVVLNENEVEKETRTHKGASTKSREEGKNASREEGKSLNEFLLVICYLSCFVIVLILGL